MLILIPVWTIVLKKGRKIHLI